MIFKETDLSGAYIIEIEKCEDERGFFARTWDSNVYKENGLNPNLVQSSISFNIEKGTIRGMHFQKPPHEEDKVVRCTRGKIFDVIIDLRNNSPTFTKWQGFELSENNHKMIYIPKGFAHGFQTMEKDSEVFYQMSEYFMPEYASGVRWDDPAFKITWPLPISVISKKDLSYSHFKNK
ncbi:dTDP-4-dehydrorhamnose 3,5-epimerase [Candidatus Nitrosarchaeum limnium]|jgi:dTDP-4-dehydrorhamnose 3,5-epimerase|uniref:dTDP-4-dehydrorhamnose 3,5-epimerase n=1 Tax=Candidatus Nitrosarchaeum limnium BG20 TaxID=859192 RepID=S2EKS5_9ARCH|nr:dTDP-4-dehydrorhamnose 3,5-epimerase [Candidatus Nitrosarchaeum limnium]EPA05247.1 dTDP-4-dehydrorhamnose 3,5-epimerase [Candidatus Nitrosarchaeum limnium BG20]